MSTCVSSGQHDGGETAEQKQAEADHHVDFTFGAHIDNAELRAEEQQRRAEIIVREEDGHHQHPEGDQRPHVAEIHARQQAVFPGGEADEFPLFHQVGRHEDDQQQLDGVVRLEGELPERERQRLPADHVAEEGGQHNNRMAVAAIRYL